MCRKRAKAVRPLTFALFARALVAVLGGNRVVNLAVDCCRFSDAGKGKLGTILAHFWHNFGTNDFDILQLIDFKYVCLWCREGGSNPHGRKGRRILSPLRLPVPPSRPGWGTAWKVSHRLTSGATVGSQSQPGGRVAGGLCTTNYV